MARGTVTALQRALDALGLDTLSTLREIDGWITSVGSAGERYSSKAKRLEDSVRAALRNAAAGGKQRGDPAQLSLADTTTAAPLTLSLPPHRREWSIAEAQGYCESLADDGAACPCCGQNVKLYRRKLYATPARQLIILWQQRDNDAEGWTHIGKLNEIVSGGGDAAKLRYWGLVEAADERSRLENSSGMWRITERGEAFVCDRLRVRKYVLLFDGRVIGFDGDEIGVRDALGTAFDYAELLEG
jgi:hypothetical protein